MKTRKKTKEIMYVDSKISLNMDVVSFDKTDNIDICVSDKVSEFLINNFKNNSAFKVGNPNIRQTDSNVIVSVFYYLESTIVGADSVSFITKNLDSCDKDLVYNTAAYTVNNYIENKRNCK